MTIFPSLRLRGLDGLPKPWLAALGMTVLGLGFYLGVVLPAEQDLADLESRVQALQMKTAMAGRTSRMDPGRQLADFYRRFPTTQSAPDWLAKIKAAAVSHHLKFLEGNYRLVAEPSGQLAGYQIILPLSGAYPDIRGFIQDVLSAVPTASLDNVSFERQKIGDSGVLATIRLTLYLRRTS
ncbi:MAG TPA: hypothetical protein VF811_05480 [Parasulfuritortus sp.]